MTSRLAEMEGLNQGEVFGKFGCSFGEAYVETSTLTRLWVEQGWQCGSAPRS